MTGGKMISFSPPQSFPGVLVATGAVIIGSVALCSRPPSKTSENSSDVNTPNYNSFDACNNRCNDLDIKAADEGRRFDYFGCVQSCPSSSTDFESVPYFHESNPSPTSKAEIQLASLQSQLDAMRPSVPWSGLESMVGTNTNIPYGNIRILMEKPKPPASLSGYVLGD